MTRKVLISLVPLQSAVQQLVGARQPMLSPINAFTASDVVGHCSRFVAKQFLKPVDAVAGLCTGGRVVGGIVKSNFKPSALKPLHPFDIARVLAGRPTDFRFSSTLVRPYGLGSAESKIVEKVVDRRCVSQILQIGIIEDGKRKSFSTRPFDAAIHHESNRCRVNAPQCWRGLSAGGCCFSQFNSNRSKGNDQPEIPNVTKVNEDP